MPQWGGKISITIWRSYRTFQRLTKTDGQKPSTTSYTEPDLAPHLEIVPIPGAERSESDDELYERIESDMTYKPTDAELDKFLEYKSKQPKYALDLIKGVWHGGKAVVGDLAKGVWGAVKDPELMLSPNPYGNA